MMRKFALGLFVLLVWIVDGRAERLGFEYGATVDVVSCYMWRGMYNGGLALQPDVSVGLANENVSIDVGTSWSFSASDWKFQSGLPKEDGYNPNTKFNKEVDLYISGEFWGAMVGVTHYYYFDRTNFFNFGSIKNITGTAQTEVTVGYDFSSLWKYGNLQTTFNLMISGDDDEGNNTKRVYSSYIEAKYAYELKHNITLTGILGFSPWKGIYTDVGADNEKNFAVNCLSLRCDKLWQLKNGMKLSVYGQVMMNTCNLNSKTAVINAAGDDKLARQKLMAGIGFRVEL